MKKLNHILKEVLYTNLGDKTWKMTHINLKLNWGIVATFEAKKRRCLTCPKCKFFGGASMRGSTRTSCFTPDSTHGWNTLICVCQTTFDMLCRLPRAQRLLPSLAQSGQTEYPNSALEDM